MPPARFLSNEVAFNQEVNENVHTAMLMQFGQYLDHDLSFTPSAFRRTSCCKDDTQSECFPLRFEKGRIDKTDCATFTRSTPHCDDGVSPRQQMNAITSFIDASNVYGSDIRQTKRLRKFKDGLLTTLDGELLPSRAGDSRFRAQPTLMAMHTIFMREHNRIAREIKKRNRSLKDEKIFQEARRIVIAEWQGIVYQEYVPIIIGNNQVKEFGLKLDANEGSTYNPEQDPSIINSFATAAYRFGHSQV